MRFKADLTPAMVSVAEQFSNLRNTLGSILGIFTLLRWLRTLLAKITGRPPPADATSLTPSAFASFQGLTSLSPSHPGAPPTPSRKPFVIFLLAVFGLPYLMSKLIRSLAKSAEEQQQQQQQLTHHDPNNNPYAPLEQSQPLDPSKLDFCRLLYDYPPPSSPPPPSSSSEELSVKKGDLVAVLSKTDPMGQNSEWWRCRSRDGRTGWLPGVYLEIVQRRPQGQSQITEKGDGEAGRVNTMSTLGGTAESRSNSLKKEEQKVPIPVPVPVIGKGIGQEATAAENTVEGFQRGGFYS